MTEQNYSRSQAGSPPPNPRGPLRRSRTQNNFPAPSNNLLTHDHNLGRAEIMRDQQDGTRKTLSQNMPLTQEISMEHYSGMTLDGYNPDDDYQSLIEDGMHPSFDINFADMPSYVSFDPTDSNIFQTPALAPCPVSDAFAPAVVPAHLAEGKGSSVQGQETLGVGFEGWPCFRCNPSSGVKVHPKTGRTFVEGLEHTLKNHDTVQPSTSLLAGDAENYAFSGGISVDQFSGRARDKLMVVTQTILHKAREVHGSSVRDRLDAHQLPPPSTTTSFEVFSTLPPTNDLEHLLQAYASRFEPYYASIPSELLSPMDILESTQERCSSLLLLLMLAQGAIATPTHEARNLTSGLTEACRISWLSLVEQDVSLSTNTTMLRSALMFMNLAAWSGNKWHMDVSIAFPKCGMLRAKKRSLLPPNSTCTFP